MRYDNLIFDLDDTLCHCHRYYTDAIDRVVEMTTTRTGLESTFVRKLYRSLDDQAWSIPGGFKASRFPQSLGATSLAADALSGIRPNHDAFNLAVKIGWDVYEAEYELKEGARHILDKVKADGKRLILYTLGDPRIQERKLSINDIQHYFDDRTYVVAEKNSSVLQRILDDLQLHPERTVVIGDSLKNDIASAHGADIHSVWVREENEFSSPAGLEEKHPPTYIITTLTELLDHI